MTKYILPAVVCMAIGAILGITGYKKLHPVKACPTLSDVKTEVETRTIIRYVDERGKPAEKETVVTNKEQKTSIPLITPRPKNVFGISGRITPQGEVRVGPTYGRELFPYTYVTGGILVTPQGKKPELLLGIQINF